jgi:signal peptidase I
LDVGIEFNFKARIMVKKRNPFLAALASLLTCGLGQLYNGKPFKAAAAYIFWLVCAAFWTFAPLSSSLSWLLAAFILNIIVIVIPIIDSFRDARKSKELTLRRYNRWYVYLAIILVQLFLISPVFKGLIFSSTRAFKFPSGSMDPTLEIGDRVVVNPKAYTQTTPRRGDIAVLKYPKDESVFYLKRVIGLPGEKVEMIGRTVYVNDLPLKESHTKYINLVSIYDHYGPYWLSKDEYFLLGDNRDNSQDSRFLGSVDRSKFIGKVGYIYWAKDKSRIGKRPE